MNREFVGYMCLTEFDHEGGEVPVIIYNSLDELFKLRACAEECGVIKVKVTAEKVLLERDY